MTVLRTMITYRGDDRATIFVEGDIDVYTAPALRTAVAECLSRGAGDIDVDLSRLTFCDASGLTAFLIASRRAGAVGGRLRLHGASPQVRRVFRLTGTSSLLEDPPQSPVPAPGDGSPAALVHRRTAATGDH